MPGDTSSRRDFLAILGASGIIGLSGCSEAVEDPTSTSELADSGSGTTSPSPTPTPIDDKAPSIIEYEALPEDYGTKLNVLLRGEDNRAIAYAAISYGDRILETEPVEPEIELDGVLEDIPDAEPTFPGQVVYSLRDAAGNVTEKTAYADKKAPTLTVSPRTTQNAGELELLVEGMDEVGLHELRIELNGASESVKDLTGQKNVFLQQTVTADRHGSLRPGEMNSVEAVLEDAMGNTTRKRIEQYVRKYDTASETRLDIAGLYNPNQGRVWQNCLSHLTETKPALGIPGDPIDSENTTRHLDQMAGHGITTAVYTTIGHPNNRYWLEEFLQSDLVDTIQIGARYWISMEWRWTESADSWKDILKSDMNWIRDEIISRENAREYENRPVVTIGDAARVVWSDEMYNRLKKEWGDLNTFVEDIRSHLKVNEKDPFLIGGFNGYGAYGYDDRFSTLAKQFDGISNWLGRGPHTGEDKAIGWENLLTWMEENYRGHRKFVEKHVMEFIPVVFPGFNERMNECREAGRYTPRSQEGFKNLLELADEYRTTDMINIGTWNAWSEGTQIEPGTFRGYDYGTEYLEVVKGIQERSPQ